MAGKTDQWQNERNPKKRATPKVEINYRLVPVRVVSSFFSSSPHTSCVFQQMSVCEYGQ
jgi:hypothetical protein